MLLNPNDNEDCEEAAHGGMFSVTQTLQQVSDDCEVDAKIQGNLQIVDLPMSVHHKDDLMVVLVRGWGQCIFHSCH